MQLRGRIKKIIATKAPAFRRQIPQLRLRHAAGEKIDRVTLGHPHARHVHILAQYAGDGDTVVKRVVNEQDAHGRDQFGASNSATRSALAKGNGRPNGVPIA